MSEQVNIDEIIFQEPRKTFMEVLKVNQREVPFANVLAYFFRPNEKHGLGDLFIQSLLNTNCSELDEKKIIDKKLLLDNYFTDNLSNKRIYRKVDFKDVKVEYPTIDGNRIDIVIKKDDFVICIEFKINHDFNNPLQDYVKTIYNDFPQQKCYFVVLTPLRKEPKSKALDYLKGQNKEFKQVILKHFFENIQQSLPTDFSLKPENQYFTDFIQTVKNRTIKHQRFLLFQRLQNEIPELKYNSKKHNGFFEIQKKDFILKIRIVENGWQFEKWIDNNRQPQSETLRKDTIFESLVTKIKVF